MPIKATNSHNLSHIVNGLGEVFLYGFEQTKPDTLSFKLWKCSSTLTHIEWVTDVPMDSINAFQKVQLAADAKGDVLIGLHKAVNSATLPISYKTFLYKTDRKNGQITLLKTFEGGLVRMKRDSTGSLFLFLIQATKTYSISNFTMIKLDAALQTEWTHNMSYSTSGFFDIALEKGGVTIIGSYYKDPVIDGAIYNLRDHPLLITHFSNDGRVSHKTMSPTCCPYGFHNLLYSADGSYIADAGQPRTIAFGEDTIKEEPMFLNFALLNIDAATGSVSIGKDITPLRNYSFTNPVLDARGIFGFYNQQFLLRNEDWHPDNVTRIAMRDYQLKEIWSKNLDGEISELINDNKGSLYVFGHFKDSITIEERQFKLDGWNMFVSKYNIKSFGIPDLPKTTSEISVFPNPSKVAVTVQFEKTKVKPYNLKFYTSLGQQVFELKESKRKINISIAHWENGTYYLRVTEDGEDPKTIKIIKIGD